MPSRNVACDIPHRRHASASCLDCLFERVAHQSCTDTQLFSGSGLPTRSPEGGHPWDWPSPWLASDCSHSKKSLGSCHQPGHNHALQKGTHVRYWVLSAQTAAHTQALTSTYTVQSPAACSMPSVVLIFCINNSEPQFHV